MLVRLRKNYKEIPLLRSFIGVGGMYMLGVPLGLAISILLARQLGPEEFGQYVFITSILALLVLPVSGGVPQLLTREVARFAHAGQWGMYRGAIRAAHVWVLIVATCVVAVFFVGKSAGIIPPESKWALLGVVILLVPLQGLNAVRKGTIKGLGFPALAEIPMQTVQPVLVLAALGVLTFLGILNVRNALWVQVGVTAATFIIASLLFFRVRPKKGKSSIPEYQYKPWLMSLLPFTLIALVGTFNAQIGIVFLGLLGTDEAVGALRVADRGAQLVSLALMLLNMVISPHIVKAYQSSDRRKLQKLSQQSARVAFIIAILVAFILIVFGKLLIVIAFGDEYRDVVYIPMIILVAGQLFNVAMGSVGIILVMSGYEKSTLWGQLTGLLATVISSVLLIPMYEVIGAAIAISIGLFAWNGAMSFSVFKYLKIRPGIL